MTDLLKATIPILGFVAVACVLGLALGPLDLFTGSARDSSPEDLTELLLVGIPPMDAAAPQHTETATFALG